MLPPGALLKPAGIAVSSFSIQCRSRLPGHGALLEDIHAEISRPGPRIAYSEVLGPGLGGAFRCFRQRDLSLRTLMLAYCRPVEIWVIR